MSRVCATIVLNRNLTDLPLGPFLGQSPLRAVSAQVMSSNVTNISQDEIVCLLFDKNLDVISEVTHHEQPLSFKHEAVEIYAAGCGVHRALINSQNVEREVGPFIAGLCNGLRCTQA